MKTILTQLSDDQLEKSRDLMLQNNPDSSDIADVLIMEIEQMKKRLEILESICIS